MHTSDVVKKANQYKKSTQWGTLRTIHWFPWSFLKITRDIRCASKWINWCQSSSNCLSNRIRQIYRYSLHCTKKALDKGLVPLISHQLLPSVTFNSSEASEFVDSFV